MTKILEEEIEEEIKKEDLKKPPSAIDLCKLLVEGLEKGGYEIKQNSKGLYLRIGNVNIDKKQSNKTIKNLLYNICLNEGIPEEDTEKLINKAVTHLKTQVPSIISSVVCHVDLDSVKDVDKTYEVDLSMASKEINLSRLLGVSDEILTLCKECPNDFALLLAKRYDAKSMLDNDEILLFKNGHYNLNGEPTIKKLCDSLLDRDYIEGFYHSVCQKIVATTSRIESRDIEEPIDKINVKNGIVDISSIHNGSVYDENGNFDINKMKLESHNSEHNFLYRMNVDFKPEADCPNLKKFLRESVRTDDDFMCLQEIFGYLLYPTYLFDKLFILYGRTHSHKSKTTGVMEIFVGRESVSNISMHILHERFVSCDLYGKRLLICSEVSSDDLSEPEMIKKLVGHDRINADVKNKKPIKFYNHAKVIGTSNKLPGIDTDDDAIMEKIVLLDFPFDFSDENSEEVMKRITTQEEMSGLLNWAIEGLARLIKNNKFTYNHDETVERWEEIRKKVNPISEFVGKCLDVSVDLTIPNPLLYDIYTLYCAENSMPAIDSRTFGKDFRKFSFVKDKDVYRNRPTVMNVDEKRDFVWNGIGLKSELLEKEIYLKHILKSYNMQYNFKISCQECQKEIICADTEDGIKIFVEEKMEHMDLKGNVCNNTNPLKYEKMVNSIKFVKK